MKPETVRLYPCLVFRNTPLAALYEQGKFRPWSLERTKQELGQALPVFWEHGVVVSRIGLSREASMEGEIIAGPEHPALGQSVRGHALLEVVRSQCETLGRPPVRLDVPRRYQGELMGHGRELAGIYETLGLGRSSIRYVEGSDFTLT